MGQFRDTIRQMVRSELANRLLEITNEEKHDSKSVYRSSKYIDIWNDIPKGEPTTEITPKPTKFDFVRRVMSMLSRSDKTGTTSAIHLEPEQKEKAIAVLSPYLKDPDEFIETMNKERGIVFGQVHGGVIGGKLRSAPDPVVVLLQQYLSDKEVLADLEANVKLDQPKKLQEKHEEGEYDIIPGATSKADIARSLSSDPTETTTEMSVLNRIEKAMNHLNKDKNLEILELLKDADVDKNDKASIMHDLEHITQIAKTASTKYATMFVDSMIDAMKRVKNVDSDKEVDDAIKAGIDKFTDSLKNAGTFSQSVNKNQLNPYEFNVFTHVLDQQEGRWSVLDMILIAAKKPAQSDMYRDEAVSVAKEAFEEEADKQTNFNSLGDFTDAMPEIKDIRQNIFSTLSKRGRKKGSTKAVMATGATDSEEEGNEE